MENIMQLKSGVSANIIQSPLSGIPMPINGLRHNPTDSTTGWYIWAGDYSDSEDFFLPWHTFHLVEKHPAFKRYLELPPGSRFQIDLNGYEDIWFDESLLKD